MKSFDQALQDAFVAGYKARENGEAPGPAYGDFRSDLVEPEDERSRA